MCKGTLTMTMSEDAATANNGHLTQFMNWLSSHHARASLSLVSDNCKGLAAEAAQSYIPPSPRARISDSSMPGLHRWESECAAAAMLDLVITSEEQEPSISPRAPRRRSSLEIDWDSLVEDDDSEAEEDDEDDDVQASTAQTRRLPPRQPERRTSFRNVLDAEIDDNQEDDDDEEDDDGRLDAIMEEISMNDSSSRSNRTRLRRHGVQGGRPSTTAILEEIQREMLMLGQASDYDDDMEEDATETTVLEDDSVRSLPHFHPMNNDNAATPATRFRVEPYDATTTTSTKKKRGDSLPCCAQRRPSPQLLEKSLSMIDLAPNCARRRPSPIQQLEKALSCSDFTKKGKLQATSSSSSDASSSASSTRSSNCRVVSRRPSPPELEAATRTILRRRRQPPAA